MGPLIAACRAHGFAGGAVYTWYDGGQRRAGGGDGGAERGAQTALALRDASTGDPGSPGGLPDLPHGADAALGGSERRCRGPEEVIVLVGPDARTFIDLGPSGQERDGHGHGAGVWRSSRAERHH